MRVTEVCSAPSPLPSPARGEGTLARRIVQGVDFFVGLGLVFYHSLAPLCKEDGGASLVPGRAAGQSIWEMSGLIHRLHRDEIGSADFV